MSLSAAFRSGSSGTFVGGERHFARGVRRDERGGENRPARPIDGPESVDPEAWPNHAAEISVGAKSPHIRAAPRSAAHPRSARGPAHDDGCGPARLLWPAAMPLQRRDSCASDHLHSKSHAVAVRDRERLTGPSRAQWLVHARTEFSKRSVDVSGTARPHHAPDCNAAFAGNRT